MHPPSDPPVDSIAPLFEHERARLLDLLRSLADDQWQRPTPCPEWTVLGLTCHLLGDDFGLLSRRRDRYLGTPSPEAATEDQFIDWLDELQREWVRAARRLSPRLGVELLGWTGPRLTATMASEDLTRRSGQVSWAGQPAPVWLDLLRELSEYWIHRQQLLEALGRPADLDPVLLRPILLGLRWAYPFRLSQAGVGNPGDAIRITIGEPIDDTWLLVADADADGHGWGFSDRPHLQQRTIATASLSADQAWRLLTNNLVDRAGTTLDITGDERAIAVLTTTRAIIGHPQ